AEDCIRDFHVTGVQTCALPILVITKEPVQWYCATFMPPKGFQTLQIDMHIAESVGIFKFDILAQRGLSKIKDAIELIRENQPNEIGRASCRARVTDSYCPAAQL